MCLSIFPEKFVHGEMKALIEGGLVELVQFPGQYALQT